MISIAFKKTLTLFVLFCALGSSDVLAASVPSYCEEDSKYRELLRDAGPVIAVGASGSSGLGADDFPGLVAGQMCLTTAAGFDYHYLFSFGSKYTFLKRQYKNLRPKIVIAIDYLHHTAKSKKYDERTLALLDRELALLTLDCNHLAIDCSRDGEYHYVAAENYKPVVLLGDIYAFYAVDCTQTDPFAPEPRKHKNPEINEIKARGCIQDYVRINEYLHQKASENPNLIMFPMDGFFRNIHQEKPFLYNINGNAGNFYTDDLFWDRFHPWSEPGAQVFANLILDKLNELIENEILSSSVLLPYIDIEEKYFRDFTGIVLLGQPGIENSPAARPRFLSTQGEEYRHPGIDEIETLTVNGSVTTGFKQLVKSLVSRVGDNPLVLNIERITMEGDIVLTDDQWSILNKVSNDPENRLQGSVWLTLSPP